MKVFGVTAPQVRGLARELYGDVDGRWTIGDALECGERLMRYPELESKSLGILLLGRFRRFYPRSLFATARVWLDDDLLTNWAAVDAFAPAVITPLLDRYPTIVTSLVRWGRARNHWRRRAAVVGLVLPARRGRHLDQAYALVAGLFGDREDLMHKACGWLLREAGKTDSERLERFLLKHGPAIPRTTVRYAIERFPEPRRKRVLIATRG